MFGKILNTTYAPKISPKRSLGFKKQNLTRFIFYNMSKRIRKLLAGWKWCRRSMLKRTGSSASGSSATPPTPRWACNCCHWTAASTGRWGWRVSRWVAVVWGECRRWSAATTAGSCSPPARLTLQCTCGRSTTSEYIYLLVAFKRFLEGNLRHGFVQHPTHIKEVYFTTKTLKTLVIVSTGFSFTKVFFIIKK